jgi:imidazolonepropionase-like amidohydrolase
MRRRLTIRALGLVAGIVAGIGWLAQGTLSAQQAPSRTGAAPAPTRTRGAAAVSAQPVAGDPASAPMPATNPAGLYAIQNARIVTNAGPTIDRGTIVIERGKIKAVGANVAVPAGAEVVNGEGLQVYPGLFDSISRLGLTEISAVAASNDETELGAHNPQVVAATAVNPVTEHIPIARANGLTHALAAPGLSAAATLGGQASAIHLSGWTVEEMLVKKSVAQVLNWPSLDEGRGGLDFATFSVRRRPFSEIKADYDKKIHELEDWFERTRRYQLAREHPGSDGARDRDLKLDALVPVIKGELPLLVRADRERDIKNAVEFCEKQKVKMILASGEDSYKVADLLAKKNIPVILGPVQALPLTDDEPYDVRNTTPGVLQNAGVKFALATFNSADSRTLPYEIGNAVSYGLSWDDAFKAITLYPAQILGLADQLGSLEPGKIANLFVTNGDPLEIRTQVRYLFINGQPTSLENRHHQLYEKWRGRPRPTTTATPTTGSK